MKKRVKNYIRKRLHLRYVNSYINSIRWEIINTVITASATEYNYAVQKHLDNLGNLIRKYERRRRWLKF